MGAFLSIIATVKAVIAVVDMFRSALLAHWFSQTWREL